MNRYEPLGHWINDGGQTKFGPNEVSQAVRQVAKPVYIIEDNGHFGVAEGGRVSLGHMPANASASSQKTYPLTAFVPGLHPQKLGDPLFKRKLGIRYAYVVGAMANGISSMAMVEKVGRAGMLGFFGAAGLSASQIESAIHETQKRLDTTPFGFNLIHSPSDPGLEMETVRLYLKYGIQLVSASAYMDLTLPLVYYRVKGLKINESGDIIPANKIMAKISREEVARKFVSPPPVKILKQLLDAGLITETEAKLAELIPMADAMTAEADSGGHTDNRPALTLLPTMIAVRNRAAKKYAFKDIPCVGLGGGIATPESAAAAFAMGAAYILTGSINQSCVEAGTSATVRQMLSEAGQADVTMAPAADMFEMGVKVQVLKRGTMFPLRAGKLYDLYSSYDRYESIPVEQRTVLERDIFRRSFQEEWAHTKIFFNERDPGQIERAQTDPKHQMALVFRSYLGQSSMWANTGEPSRKIDYQIWCGPSMGAFNNWVKGTFLEKTENRQTVVLAMNLLVGAAVCLRTNCLRQYGIDPLKDLLNPLPLELDKIMQILGEV